MADQPNILIIWGDDIGITNLSCYSDGLMGYRTPNIDRLADEGVRFTDYYGEQSCTAGRAAFITGQNPYRTGLTKVGFPGADIGLRAEDPTIATALKAQGYATGQFGKNHFGDRDEFLPTMHGFDEFFGNLYHLNAEEEPEQPGLPDRRGVPRVPRAVRSTRRDPRLGQRRRHAAHRGHRRADEGADEDVRRGVPRRRGRLHPSPARRRHALLRVAQHDPHALPDAHPGRGPRPGRPVAVPVPRHDAVPRRDRRPGARPARRARHRRRHDRDVLDRQRPAHELVARCRDDALPQREELQLGRARTASRASCAGRATSRPAPC